MTVLFPIANEKESFFGQNFELSFTQMHCTESLRPFELFANENCELQNEAKMNVTFQRGSARDALAQSSLC